LTSCFFRCIIGSNLHAVPYKTAEWTTKHVKKNKRKPPLNENLSNIPLKKQKAVLQKNDRRTVDQCIAAVKDPREFATEAHILALMKVLNRPIFAIDSMTKKIINEINCKAYAKKKKLGRFSSKPLTHGK